MISYFQNRDDTGYIQGPDLFYLFPESGYPVFGDLIFLNKGSLYRKIILVPGAEVSGK